MKTMFEEKPRRSINLLSYKCINSLEKKKKPLQNTPLNESEALAKCDKGTKGKYKRYK